jgi:hypothetical protein
LWSHYRTTRELTVALVAPLGPEDCCVQSMPDASPAKWHLAHTTWLFEALILAPFNTAYKPIDSRYAYPSIPTTKRSVPAIRVRNAA